MKKALIVATVGGFICSFEKNDIKLLKNLGYEVFIACNTEGREEELEQLECKIVHLPIARSPFKKQNLACYKKLKFLMKQERFDLVHCHTPVGGVLARMAAKKYRKTGIKVIYTAHGFHFFKGAPLVNWLIYYPVERWLSRYTDIQITINHEDYKRAKTFHAKKVEYVPGVGVDLEKFSQNDISQDKREQLQREFEINQKDIVLLSVGELSPRKNQRVVIEAIFRLQNKNIKYLLVGEGPLKEEYQKLSEKFQLENQVFFTGFRRDIKELCAISDVFVFPSLQEGLPVALMEAMSSELPIVCSAIRGNIDLIEDGKGGFLVNPRDCQEVLEKIKEIIEHPTLAEQMARCNRERIKEFSEEKVREKMRKIYANI